MKQNDKRPVAVQLRELVSHFNALLPHDLSLATSARLPELANQLRTDIVAVATEAITNAAKYSGATHIDLDLQVEGDTLRLVIVDDGIGIGIGSQRPTDAQGGNGLRNMARRAERNGGTCSVFDGPTRGTVVQWVVPFTNQPAPAIHLDAQ
ncbi:MAG: ATP-binding protein [Acidimicrobiales bacterium]